MNWRKTARWFVFTALAILAMLFLATGIIVRTAAFNRFVRAQIEQRLQRAIGARVEIGALAIHWSGLSADAYNIVLYGRESSSQFPLFTADHLGVGVKIVSLLRRKVELNSITLDHPTFRLNIDAQGRSNLPEPPAGTEPASSSAASVSTMFDLAIHQLDINSGVVNYNDARIPLSAELQGFHAQVRFNNFTREYKASLGYDFGRLVFTNFRPVPHDLQWQVTASRKGMVVDQLVFTTGGSRITARASLTDYEHPAIEGSYQGTILTTDAARVFDVPSIPAGEVAVSGTVHYRGGSAQHFLDAFYVDGNLTSPALVLDLGRASARATSIRATYRLQNGNLSVQNVAAAFLGGQLEGSFQMLHLGSQSVSRLQASLRGVSLESAGQELGAHTETVRVIGKVDVTAQASWARNIRDADAHLTMLISGPLQPLPGNSSIPVNGKIDVHYDGARAAASFDHSYVRTASTELSVTGLLSDRSDLNVQATARDLHELAMLVSEIELARNPVAGQTPLSVLDLQGSAQFAGQVRGSTRNPRIMGELAAANFQVAGSRWRALRTNVDVSSSAFALQDATLSSAQQGQITFNVRTSLSDWSFTPASTINAQATATHLSAADLERLGNMRYPITGEISANLSFDGSQQHPSGHGSLSLTQGVAWNEPIHAMTVEFEGDGTTIRTMAQLRVPAGTLSASLNYSPATRAYEASVNTPGLRLAQLRTIQARSGGVSGTLTGSASGSGNVDAPQMDATFQVSAFQIRDRSIPQLQAHVSITGGHAAIALNADLAPGSVQAKGDIVLAGEYPVTATADAQGLPVGLLAASYLPNSHPDLFGQVDVHATITGPLKDPAGLQAHVEIPSVSLKYQSQQIASTHPLVMDYRNGVVAVQPLELKGSGTDLSLQGAIPIYGASPLNIVLKGNLDLAALKGFGTDLDSSGRVEVNISASGNLSHPVMQGQLSVVNATLSSAAIPVGLDNVNGQFNLNGNRLDIGHFSATAGGGSIAATGSLVYGESPTFDLTLNAKTVRVRYPEGVRSIVDGDIQLHGTSASSVLSGSVLIDGLSFSKEFDMATLAAQLSNSSAPAPSGSFESKMNLNMTIRSAQNLNAQSNQLSIEGSTNLSLGGTLANPVLLGRMALTGGDIFFLGKRYEVQSGTVEFANPVRTEPILNLFMNTTVEQYNITLNFVGPIDRLKTNYTSTPALPPSDIINLIAFGKTAEEAGVSTGPSTVGAESVLAQGVSGQLSGRIEKLAGISQLTIDPLAGSNSTDPGSQIAIQQRVTGNLLLTFSTNVTTAQSEAVQLRYQESPNISISVLRDQNGGYALDIRVRKTF